MARLIKNFFWLKFYVYNKDLNKFSWTKFGCVKEILN